MAKKISQSKESAAVSSNANPKAIRSHTLSILVQNKFGTLSRVAGLFSGRGFNIQTLNVAPTQNPRISHMTVTLSGDNSLDQAIKQLSKLVEVLEVIDLQEGDYTERELMLVKVACDVKSRPEIMQFCEIFRGKIIDVQHRALTIELTGSTEKLEKFLDLLRPHKLLELVRSGRLALKRSETPASAHLKHGG
jgi:acetolactate synthase-1/3 small subunit